MTTMRCDGAAYQLGPKLQSLELTAVAPKCRSAIVTGVFDQARPYADVAFWCTPGTLAAMAALAYDSIPDLPLAPQSDEPKKADFVIRGHQDFFQPLLLLQTVPFANLFAQHLDQLTVVELGRSRGSRFRRIGSFRECPARAPGRRVMAGLAAGLLAWSGLNRRVPRLTV